MIKYRNLHLKSLNHGGVFTALEILAAKSLLTIGRGIYDAGGIYGEYNGIYKKKWLEYFTSAQERTVLRE